MCAHTKITFGAERPEPDSLVRDRMIMERLTQQDAVPVSTFDASQEIAPVPMAMPTLGDVTSAPVMALPQDSGEDPFARWMRRQRWERMAMKGPGVSVTLPVFALNETETHVHAAYEAKTVRFVLRKERKPGEEELPPSLNDIGTVVELGWEDRLTLWFRDTSCPVLFANGMVHFPGWPFHIISFFKVGA